MSKDTNTPTHGDEAEANKLKAEAAKLIAEANKLTVEADYLARPIWRRAEAIAVIGSVMAAVVGLAGVLWTQSITTQREELIRQKEQFAAEKDNFTKAKERLDQQINDLTEKKDRLDREKVALAANVAILSDRTVAAGQKLEEQNEENSQLRTAANQLKNEKLALEKDARYWRVDALLEELRLAYSDGNGNTGVAYALTDLIKSAPDADREAWIRRCEEKADAATEAPSFRLKIESILFALSKRQKFHYELIGFASRYFFGFNDPVNERTLLEYRNLIRTMILPELSDVDKLDLVNALWHVDLEEGQKLSAVPWGQLPEFLGLNRRALEANPAIYFLTIAELQKKLIAATNQNEIDALVTALSIRSPQCLVLTWYFAEGSKNWPTAAKESLAHAEMSIKNPPSARFFEFYLPQMVIPKAGSDAGALSEWRHQFHGLVKFWVPIKYDAAAYDPLIQKILERPAIGIQDLISAP